jgi:uncharacterized protein
MSERTGYRAGTPCWVDLTTTDPAAAMTFYAELFGWDLDRGGEDAGGYTMCRLEGAAVAGINGQPGPEGMPPLWVTYLASDDLDATADRIDAAGGQVMMGPMEVMEQGRMALAADPTGALVGVWQARAHRGAQRVDEPSTLTWNELVTRDLEAAAAFYAAAFGHSVTDVKTGGDPDYWTFAVGDRLAGGMRRKDAGSGDAPSHWLPYFAVDDVDDATRRATDLGGTVLAAPEQSTYGRIATIRDPQGAALALLGMSGG